MGLSGLVTKRAQMEWPFAADAPAAASNCSPTLWFSTRWTPTGTTPFLICKNHIWLLNDGSSIRVEASGKCGALSSVSDGGASLEGWLIFNQDEDMHGYRAGLCIMLAIGPLCHAPALLKAPSVPMQHIHQAVCIGIFHTMCGQSCAAMLVTA